MAAAAVATSLEPIDGLRPRVPQQRRHLPTNGLEKGEHLNGLTVPDSNVTSGTSTPVPEDAPPSVKSISSARQQIRAQHKKRLFPTVEYSERVSHFDPRSDYHDFKGFFVLFWIGLVIMVITTGARNWKETGLPLRSYTWSLLSTGVWQLGLSDLAMVVSTLPVVGLQQIFRRAPRPFNWALAGMPIHSVFEASWLGLWINWPFMLQWTWTAQVFFTLHTLVILMKIHSYAFYNGHLSTTERRLSDLDHSDKKASNAPAERYPSPTRTRMEIAEQWEKIQNAKSPASLAQLREDLAHELTSPLGQVTYPQNLTYTNYADYILCPTLCYELEYPRSKEGIRYLELFWKVLATFGCIFLLITVSDEFILPVLRQGSIELNAPRLRTSEKLLIFAETISQLLFPFMITMLLVFLVIFEYILGALAEITCFADRHFYSDWWNSCDWLEFSRKWNVPVHHFLRRHIYGASLPYLSKTGATTVTFLVSATLHELIMGCITKKLRGYGFFLMMLQIPLVAIQQSPPLRGKKLFNNVCFWAFIILGLAILCALYVLV